MDSYPEPSLVGKAFVKQYYTQMHRDPMQLHRFYLEQSSFVHGGSEIGSEEPVLGQKCIHDKIASLDLSQVHAKIKQMDSHATLGKGIVVQVTGELSTGGRPMRAFVQTFVLAPESPKKYYVHNDIFRYQDDDLSESEINEPPGELENPGLIDHVEDGLNYSVPSLPVINTADVAVVGGKEEEEEEEAVMFPPSQNTAAGGAGVVMVVEQNDMGTSGAGREGWDQPFEDPSHLRQNGLSEEAEPQVRNTDDFSMETANHVSAGGDQDAEVVVTMTEGEGFPQDIHKEDKAMSWASRIGSSSSSQNRPLNSTSVSGSQALPQRDQTRPRRTQVHTSNHTPSVPKEPLKKGGPSLNPRDAPDTWQIFVGGLPQGAGVSEIRDVFSKYDSIADVRVNPKNFAFVVFTGAGPVEKILSEKDSFQLNGKSLNIEPKRASSRSTGGGRYQSGDRTKFSGGGGGGGGVGGKIRGGGGAGVGSAGKVQKQRVNW